MKSLKTLVGVAALVVAGNGFAQTVSEEAKIVAEPKNWNVTFALETNGKMGFIHEKLDAEGHDTLTLRNSTTEELSVNFAWKPAKDWTLGIIPMVFLENSNASIGWGMLRFYAEKTGFIDTDVIGTKYTLRIEPRTTHTEKTRIRQRFDFTLPLDTGAGIRFRDEPTLDLASDASVSGFNAVVDGLKLDEKVAAQLKQPSRWGLSLNNRVEVTPFITWGNFFASLSLVNYQRTVSAAPSMELGWGLNTYLSYNFTDEVALALFVEASRPYSREGDFLTGNDLYFFLELSATI